MNIYVFLWAVCIFVHVCVCSTEKYNFLGISIVGQSNERGDGGIYIGSIMKGGAVAADGRIEPGDMLLQVCVGRRDEEFDRCDCELPIYSHHYLTLCSL